MTPWTVALQAPLPMEFSRQEHWSGLPFPSPQRSVLRGKAPGSVGHEARYMAKWLPVGLGFILDIPVFTSVSIQVLVSSI